MVDNLVASVINLGDFIGCTTGVLMHLSGLTTVGHEVKGFAAASSLSQWFFLVGPWSFCWLRAPGSPSCIYSFVLIPSSPCTSNRVINCLLCVLSPIQFHILGVFSSLTIALTGVPWVTLRPPTPDLDFVLHLSRKYHPSHTLKFSHVRSTFCRIQITEILRMARQCMYFGMRRTDSFTENVLSQCRAAPRVDHFALLRKRFPVIFFHEFFLFLNRLVHN